MLFDNYIYENKTSFIAKVKDIAFDLSINPDWLMGVMYKESKVNHRAVNTISGATGLIQFMPKTALGLGTSVAALSAMSNIRQLDYVKKYFAPYKGRIHSYVDLYLATFFPAAMGKNPEYIMQTSTLSAANIAKVNGVIDLNKDGKITVAEFARYCYVGFPAQVVEILKKKQI